MTPPDLRILALIDAKLLPPEVQSPFDHWRIWRARDAVATVVRRRVANILPIVQTYLERLEVADTEETIFQGLYAITEVVEVHRARIGLHGDYIVLIMSNQINPWGVLEFQHDFANPPPQVSEAAALLWGLCEQHNVLVSALLTRVKDPLLDALNDYYAVYPLINKPL